MIQNRDNKRFRQWSRFVEKPQGPDCPWLCAEGWKLVEDLSQDHQIELLLFSKSLAQNPNGRLEHLRRRSRESVCLSEALLKSLSSVETPQGVVAFFGKPAWSWDDIGPYLLYAHEIQDPGNLGTLLRTAAATGLFGLVASPGTVSCFNAKVVRASAGAILRVPFLQGIDWTQLKSRGVCLWLATPRRGQSLFQAQFQPPLAVVIGSEGSGADNALLEEADKLLQIPMKAQAESLNAGVAGAVILYEIYRQQDIHG